MKTDLENKIEKFKASPEQQKIIDAKSGNILVSAAAGSGKTGVMTERVSQRVLKGELDLRKVLILTFTNAASNNMSNKISQKLSDLAKTAKTNGEITLFDRLETQVSYLPAAHIETIHSFCLSLLKLFPEEVKSIDDDSILAPNFVTADEQLTKDLLDEAVARVFNDFYIELEELQSETKNKKRLDTGLMLIAAYSSGKDDEELRKLVLSVFNYLRSLPDYDKQLKQAINELKINAKDFANSPHIDYLFDELELRAKAAELAIPDLERRLDGVSLEFAGKTAKTSHEEYVDTYTSLFEITREINSLIDQKDKFDAGELWNKIFELKSKVNFIKPRKSPWKEWERLGLNGSEDISSYEKEVQKIAKAEIKNDFIDILVSEFSDLLYYLGVEGSQNLENSCKFSAKVVWTKTIAEINSEQERMLAVLELFFDLVLELDKEYQKLKTKRNVVDFSDYEHYALQIVRSEVGREYCQKQFQEVYIDEYQDTSSLEEAILQEISPNNTFMVGDVKQSIYRFRNAKPEIFLEKSKKFQDEVGGSFYQLSQNFRSQAGILAGINSVFSKLMTPEFTNIDYQNGHQMNYFECNNIFDQRIEVMLDCRSENDISYHLPDGNLSNVLQDISKARLNPYQARLWAESEKEEKNAFHIISEVLRLHREEGVEFKDIAILSRGNSKADYMAKLLQQIGVPSNRYPSLSINDDYILQNQVALLQCLDNAQTDIPLTTVMLSYLVQAPFTETELLQIRIYQKENHERGNFKAAIQFLAEASLSEGHEFYPLQCKVQKFLEELNKWRLRSVEVSVSTLLQEIWNSNNYLEKAAKYDGELAVLSLEEFLTKIENLENSEYESLREIVLALENEVENDLKPSSENNMSADAVNVLTFHKSKGLEFDYVFIYDLDKSLNNKDQQDKIFMSEELGIAYNIAEYSNYGVRTFPSHLRLAMEENEQRRFLTEEICLFYVAMSRAKEKLYLCANIDLTSDYLKLNTLLNLVETEREKAGQASENIYLPNYILSTISSYQEMLLLSMMLNDNQAVQKLIDFYRNQVEATETVVDYSAKIGDENFVINIYNDKDILEKTWQKILAYWSDKEVDKQENDEVCSDNLNYDYKEFYEFNPRAKFKSLPKVSVSELKRKSMQVDSSDGEDSVSKLKKNINLDLVELEDFDTTRLSSTDIGTAIHVVMNYLDLDKIRQAEDVDEAIAEELNKLLEFNFINRTEREALNDFRREFIAFARSQIADKVLRAGAKVYRELPFTFKYEDDNKEISLVQGIIDLWYYSDAGAVLLDYKSDYLPKNRQAARKALLDRYSVQMKIYALALEMSLGKKVNKVVIWSIRLAEEFEFTREELGI